ncbi:MAG: hypothetical protein ACRC46_15335 [Thermoguttaceae bacterium]
MAASGASSAGSYVLGLDLGVQSVGWAIILSVCVKEFYHGCIGGVVCW